MITTAVLAIDDKGRKYYKDFDINIEHLSAWGYISNTPEVWEVDVRASENQDGIGENWKSEEYFAYIYGDDPVCRIPGDGKFKRIMRNFLCYNTQFPYGWKAAESRGKTYRVDIVPIKRIL
jgi:hypothetical protein